MKYINKLLITFLIFFIPALGISEEQLEEFNPDLPAQITEANAEFVYKFLLAELAIQRNDINSAGHLYLDLAKLTKNTGFAQSAAQLGGMVRNGRLALDAADIWSKLDPKSRCSMIPVRSVPSSPGGRDATRCGGSDSAVPLACGWSNVFPSRR